jgi:hypothetical protein
LFTIIDVSTGEAAEAQGGLPEARHQLSNPGQVGQEGKIRAVRPPRQVQDT